MKCADSSRDIAATTRSLSDICHQHLREKHRSVARLRSYLYQKPSPFLSHSPIYSSAPHLNKYKRSTKKSHLLFSLWLTHSIPDSLREHHSQWIVSCYMFLYFLQSRAKSWSNKNPTLLWSQRPNAKLPCRTGTPPGLPATRLQPTLSTRGTAQVPLPNLHMGRATEPLLELFWPYHSLSVWPRPLF